MAWVEFVNLNLWLCEAEGCKEVASWWHDRGYRKDLYCARHAAERQTTTSNVTIQAGIPLPDSRG